MNTRFNKSLIRNGMLAEVSSETAMQKIWNDFITDPQERDLFLTSKSIDKLKGFFFNNFEIIEAAGGLVFNQSNQLLCIYRWNKWDLPKGKIEKGEAIETAALREVEEETGITQVEIIGFRDTTFHIYQSPHHRNMWVLKPTHWFTMNYTGSEKLVPQIKEDIEQAKWFDKTDLDLVKQNTYASLKQLFEFN